MRPSVFLLWTAALWGLAGLAVDWFQTGGLLWTLIGYSLLGLAGLDCLALWFSKPPVISRTLPEFLALGVSQEIPLRVSNQRHDARHIRVFDGVSPSCEAEGLPWAGKLPAKGFLEINYRVIPRVRGAQEFGQTHLMVRSLLGLWWRTWQVGESQEVRIFPNYEPVIRFSLLAMTNKAAQMGIRSLNRQGQSREFHQLRDYQEGDALNRMDWKATSRRAQLISREYQEQRDQTIILVLDCGRRMRVIDGDLPQFDHCLNSMLLLSHVALRQGDAVGVLGMGSDPKWLPPQKGTHSISTILHHLYAYQTENHATDFADGIRYLMGRQKRRALVIFLTNLRSEDSEHLLEPLRTLRKKHLVMVASLCENDLATKMRQPVQDFADAVTIAAGHLYMEERSTVFKRLESAGIMTLDCTAESLPVILANRYLDVKKAGTI